MSLKQYGGFDCAPQEEFNEYLNSIGIDENTFKIYADNCVQKGWSENDSRINLINETNSIIIQKIDEYIAKNNKSPADKKEILENLEFYVKTCGGLKDYTFDEHEKEESYKTCVKLFSSNEDILKTVETNLQTKQTCGFYQKYLKYKNKYLELKRNL